MTVWENEKRYSKHKAVTVYEQGRRVHGFQLTHDVLVNCLGNFKAYWATCMERR